MVSREIRKFLAEIGRKGGKKSKRTLTREQSLAMTAARERKRRRKPPHGTVILTMLLLNGAMTYAGQGWYYLIPPGPGGFPNTDAPFREWIQAAAYDTARACEVEKQEILKNLEKTWGKDSIQYKLALLGNCIASDDPRLK